MTPPGGTWQPEREGGRIGWRCREAYEKLDTQAITTKQQRTKFRGQSLEPTSCRCSSSLRTPGKAIISVDKQIETLMQVVCEPCDMPDGK